MDKTLKVIDIMDVYSDMEIATIGIEATKKIDAVKMFALESDLEFATVHTAYFEHYSSGSVDARISFHGTSDEIWAYDVESSKVKTFVLARI